jgi:hypothetical protein
MKEVNNRWETETRYYKASLYKDLFNDWILEKSWGGRFNRRRGGQGIYCKSYKEGLDKLKKLDSLRKKHKYKELN